ncbi:hypothetical protein B224_1901 [Aeromonas media WS]|nr:hypothetical protein B224_1901 [Aeromonas media WS]
MLLDLTIIQPAGDQSLPRRRFDWRRPRQYWQQWPYDHKRTAHIIA